jgi:hypothetical protein
MLYQVAIQHENSSTRLKMKYKKAALKCLALISYSPVYIFRANCNFTLASCTYLLLMKASSSVSPKGAELGRFRKMRKKEIA